MAKKEKSSPSNSKKFDPNPNLQKARSKRVKIAPMRLALSNSEYTWTSKMDRVKIIRKGLPFESIDVISARTELPIKHILQLLSIPQTTYNKKKRNKEQLSGRDSELILILIEVLDFGLDVFNNEKEKFIRWLKSPNISLGQVAPQSLFDSLSGIQEVQNSLNRIEYGNMA